MLRYSRPIVALLVAVFAGFAPAIAAVQSDEVERIQKSIVVLQELTKVPEEGIPQHLLQRAEAIVVIPTLVKGGFIVGAKHGRGVMSLRDRATGSWSAPGFIKLTGGTVGWQIGVQSVDLVLLVMNPKGVTELLEDRFTVGGNLSVAAGPLGRAAEASTNAQLSAQILAYSRAKGLFAGATLEGASLRADADALESFYGPELALKDIVVRRKLSSPLPAAAAEWQAAMKRIAG